MLVLFVTFTMSAVYDDFFVSSHVTAPGFNVVLAPHWTDPLSSAPGLWSRLGAALERSVSHGKV